MFKVSWLQEVFKEVKAGLKSRPVLPLNLTSIAKVKFVVVVVGASAFKKPYPVTFPVVE
ncbi:hypothetical protein [Carnobacterium maltaromaticum]|uniref:hypothetical protein n=1 Tax=Carnobacterium maltaromaticum TaxID=2751 RepID=UPI00130E56AE|nr:hypothetical protein [Carnobacterium maltaromaticum]